MALDIIQKREIVLQRISQLERELYMNQLNEKILIATQGDSNLIEFARKDITRCEESIAVLQAEMETLI